MSNFGGNLKRRSGGNDMTGMRQGRPNETSRSRPSQSASHQESVKTPRSIPNRVRPIYPSSPNARKPVVPAKLNKQSKSKNLKKQTVKILNHTKSSGIKASKFIGSELKVIHKQPVKLAIVVLILIICVPFSLRFFSNSSNKDQTAVEGAHTVSIDVEPILPHNELFDEASVVKDAKRGTASFQDIFDGVLITVTQQNQPADFAGSPNKLKEVAASVGASEEFQTRFGSAFLATADGEGAVGQRVVFVANDLLIFISAPTAAPPSRWATYIDSLK